jgi:hypothetical protein
MEFSGMLVGIFNHHFSRNLYGNIEIYSRSNLTIAIGLLVAGGLAPATLFIFSPQVRSLIDTLKARTGDSKTIATIIKEMNRHLMVFGKSVTNFSQSLRLSKLSRFLKG